MSTPKSIDDILKDVEQLPAMPKAVTEIIRCLDDDSVEIETLVKQISSDIGLATRILRLANTPHFSVHGNIATVHDAVMLVGFKEIRDMVCVVGVKESLPQSKSVAFDYAQFWRHSLGVAVCARILANLVRLSPDTAFISGMLHDIGQLALILSAPDEFRLAVDYRVSHGCQIFEAEQAVLGMDHAKAGAHLFKKWDFPQVICDAIEKHHMPDTDHTFLMADLIHVSEVLCHALEIGNEEHAIPPLSDQAMLRLGINFNRLKPYFAQIECEYQSAILMLD